MAGAKVLHLGSIFTRESILGSRRVTNRAFEHTFFGRKDRRRVIQLVPSDEVKQRATDAKAALDKWFRLVEDK